MSGLILIRTEVNKKHLKNFFDALSDWSLPIAKVYSHEKVIEFIFNVELLGYAEPQNFYEDVKKFVVDVWFFIVGDADLEAGKDNKDYAWESCKKKLKLDKYDPDKKQKTIDEVA